MILMRENSFRGPLEGVGPQNRINGEWSECHLGPKQSWCSGPTPSNVPSTGFTPIKIIKSTFPNLPRRFKMNLLLPARGRAVPPTHKALCSAEQFRNQQRCVKNVLPLFVYSPWAELWIVQVFEHSLQQTSGDDLAKLLLLKSPSSEVWFDRRTNFTR